MYAVADTIEAERGRRTMKLMRARLVSGEPTRAVLMLQINIEDVIKSSSRLPIGISLTDDSGNFKKLFVLKQEIALAALSLCDGHRGRAAKMLGVNRNTLLNIIPPAKLPRKGQERRRPP
jgi:DNA-binding NtrC family response regulator